MKRSKLVYRALAVIMAAAVTMSTATTLPVYAEDNIETTTDMNTTPDVNAPEVETPALSDTTTVTATDTNTAPEVTAPDAITPALSDATTVPTTDTNTAPDVNAPDTITPATDTTTPAGTKDASIAVQAAPAAIPETTTSNTETNTETTENADGTKTTTTITTTTITIPGASTTTDIKEGDADYKKLVDDQGKPILDDEGNEQYTASKTVTTGDAVKTTTTTSTLVTQDTTTTTDKLTNAEDATNKTVYTVDADGNQVKMTEVDANKVQEFLNDLNVTSDFAVYADELTGTIGHEDGNIAVNTARVSTTIMNKGNQYGSDQIGKEYATDGYSYVGQTTNNAEITTSSSQTNQNTANTSTLVVGNRDNVTVNIREESGTANHFDVEKLDSSMYNEDGTLKDTTVSDFTANHSELSTLNEVVAINKNLDTISEAGEAITSTYEVATQKTGAEDTAAINAVSALLDKTSENGEKMLGDGDVVSLSVGINTLTLGSNVNDYNNSKCLTQLINKNTNGADIVINILVGKGADEGASVTINKLMNDIKDYNGNAAHLIWNFGDYAGTIKFEGTFSGVIVAPNANVSLTEIQAGRIVAKKVSHTGEIHMAVTGKHQTTTTTTTTVKSSNTSTSTSTKQNKGTVTYTYKGVPVATPTDPTTPNVPVTPETPDVPVTPETPDVPVTPDVPATPDTPVTPETPIVPTTPETPSTPSTPETPSNTETPSTPSVDVSTSVPPVSASRLAETVSVAEVSGPQNLDTVANVSESNAPTNASTVGRSAQTGDESQMDLNGAVALSAMASLLLYAVVTLKRKKKADKV